jgi:hypothetical protein
MDEKGSRLLPCTSLKMAHRVIALLRSNLAAFGAKRTSITEAGFINTRASQRVER